MKCTRTEKSPREALMNYVMNLTPEQAEKLVRSMDFLRSLAKMSISELIFAEVFLTRIMEGGCEDGEE